MKSSSATFTPASHVVECGAGVDGGVGEHPPRKTGTVPPATSASTDGHGPPWGSRDGDGRDGERLSSASADNNGPPFFLTFGFSAVARSLDLTSCGNNFGSTTFISHHTDVHLTLSVKAFVYIYISAHIVSEVS